jgi:hypothetical protein
VGSVTKNDEIMGMVNKCRISLWTKQKMRDSNKREFIRYLVKGKYLGGTHPITPLMPHIYYRRHKRRQLRSHKKAGSTNTRSLTFCSRLAIRDISGRCIVMALG